MKELNKRIVTSLFLLCIIFFSLKSLNFLYLLILSINFFVLDEFVRIFKKIYKKKNLLQYISIILSLFYMVYFSLIILIFLAESFDANKITILFLLLICISTDIGGYFFGKIIGGRKLTRISPNKTISGLFGSFISAIVFGYLFYRFQSNLINININLFIFIILTSFISQIGDLVISYFKRKANLKDTGNILPGHGGILDRLDGIILALPFGIILIMISS